MKRVYLAIILSLFLHLLIWLLVQNWKTPERADKPVEFEVIERPKSPTPSKKELSKQMVAQTLVPEKLKEQDPNDTAKLLSEKTQRVKEETRASQSGLTENRMNAPISPHPTAHPTPSGKSGEKSLRDFSPLGIGRPQTQTDNEGESQKETPRGGSYNSGFSSIAESVDVKVGSMTALNTDQYLFYSFFHRVGQLVYLRWTHMIEASEDRVAHRLRGIAGNDRWTTEIDVWVKPNGEYHSAHIMRESTIPEFDRAAVAAFQQAGLFPNPPHELIEEDGFIHLKYNLTVYLDPKQYFQNR